MMEPRAHIATTRDHDETGTNIGNRSDVPRFFRRCRGYSFYIVPSSLS